MVLQAVANGIVRKGLARDCQTAVGLVVVTRARRRLGLLDDHIPPRTINDLTIGDDGDNVDDDD